MADWAADTGGGILRRTDRAIGTHRPKRFYADWEGGGDAPHSRVFAANGNTIGIPRARANVALGLDFRKPVDRNHHMDNTHVFEIGVFKKILGWVVFLGSAALLVTMIRMVIANYEIQTTADLWSGLVIAILLLSLMFAGLGLQRMQWSIGDESIVCRRLLKDRIFPVSAVAGFERVMFSNPIIHLAFMDLYDAEFKLVIRLPVRFKDWDRAEECLARRFRSIINDGSLALPKRRFADAADGIRPSAID